MSPLAKDNHYLLEQSYCTYQQQLACSRQGRRRPTLITFWCRGTGGDDKNHRWLDSMYIRHQKKQHLALLDLRTKTHVLPEPIIEDRVGLPYHEVNSMTGKEIRDRTERCVLESYVWSKTIITDTYQPRIWTARCWKATKQQTEEETTLRSQMNLLVESNWCCVVRMKQKKYGAETRRKAGTYTSLLSRKVSKIYCYLSFGKSAPHLSGTIRE